MRLYATPENLIDDDWLDELPKNASRLIRSASTKVEAATLMARYNVDNAGLPTDPRIAAAFKDAVCQQVTLWANASLDPDKGTAGQTPHISSQSTGGGSVSYTGTQSVQELGQQATSLDPQTMDILRLAGLLREQVVYL